MNADDLLSFKEYSPVHESHAATGRAEININSPSRQNPYGRPAQTPPTPNDPLQDLMNSLGTSVNVLHNEDRNNMQINNNGKKIVHILTQEMELTLPISSRPVSQYLKPN